MDRLLSHLPLIFISIGFLVAFFILSVVFIFKQQQQQNNKGQESKALLKRLLEEFGLEIPQELSEPHINVAKTIKGP